MAYFGSEIGEVETLLLRRSDLGDLPVRGPALVEEYDTTVVIPPGVEASRDEMGNIVLDIGLDTDS